jgi:hypothetical protein
LPHKADVLEVWLDQSERIASSEEEIRAVNFGGSFETVPLKRLGGLEVGAEGHPAFESLFATQIYDQGG